MLVNSFQHANTKNTNYCQWQQKNYLKVMVVNERKAHVFISSLFMLIVHLTLSSNLGMEYIWVVVARIIK